MRRKTTQPRRRLQSQVLHVKVWNLRIAWFAMLKLTFRLTQVALGLAVLAGLGWGVKLVIDRALYDNPDFRLQIVDLNRNPAIDENELVALTGLDLNANLFRIDVTELTRRLALRPEIEAVTVERHLPGTLMVRLTARTPQAWLACPDAGLPAERQVGGLLVDRNDVVYPCPARQFETSKALPILVLPARVSGSLTSGAKLKLPELAHCRRLLAAALAADPTAGLWVETIQQSNAWSLLLTTEDGIAATFGLGDHERQFGNLLAARAHARDRSYAIATINLIPKENVPITVGTEAAPPKAIRIDEPTDSEIPPDRHSRDLNSLLNRD